VPKLNPVMPLSERLVLTGSNPTPGTGIRVTLTGGGCLGRSSH
jgi:hypothetical protein